MSVRWVFVGLGNPGTEYDRTRHNVGFIVLDEFAKELNCSFVGGKPVGSPLTAEYKISGSTDKAILIKPQNFMNRSGGAVAETVKFFKMSPSQVVVVYDDCELDVGRIKLQAGGANGGHNGIRSIEDSLGTKEFLRIRVGISRPPQGMDLADWVLNKFAPAESDSIKSATSKSLIALKDILTEGFVRAQNSANRS